MVDDSPTGLDEVLQIVSEGVTRFRRDLADRAVAPGDVDLAALRASLGSMPEGPTPAAAVVRRLVDVAEPALVATTGPRFFGFVVGGALDSATAADMLAAGWDQPAFNPTTSPAAAAVEEVAGEWLKDVLGLPAHASFGFVTGGQGANTVGLAAARNHVLAGAGWDVEQRGLIGAPRVRVVTGVERHATIDRALRLLGFGLDVLETVPTDSNGAVVVEELARALEEGPQVPTIVCLQAGNVNSGAFDDIRRSVAAARLHDAWVHVDGAFGLWAAASSQLRHHVDGLELADSWGTDGHKWLNVPYDSGYVFCAHPLTHAASMSFTASYLTGHGLADRRAPSDYVPESSRRARGFATWAALAELGRSGIADVVERCCALARRFAEQLSAQPGVEVANDVVLNQVLVSFGDDATTDAVVEAVQRGGECWMGATTWHGRRLMRISVSNATTTEDDVDRSVKAILSTR